MQPGGGVRGGGEDSGGAVEGEGEFVVGGGLFTGLHIPHVDWHQLLSRIQGCTHWPHCSC